MHHSDGRWKDRSSFGHRCHEGGGNGALLGQLLESAITTLSTITGTDYNQLILSVCTDSYSMGLIVDGPQLPRIQYIQYALIEITSETHFSIAMHAQIGAAKCRLPRANCAAHFRFVVSHGETGHTSFHESFYSVVNSRDRVGTPHIRWRWGESNPRP